ncbi:MAG TPA: peptidoglycan DD-metalloendopeptidase family protein [Stellaceae bacterium]|nr:peptidoglycan DD-metalloendopeptidase family protein [Stellaceae bacterium]
MTRISTAQFLRLFSGVLLAAAVASCQDAQRPAPLYYGQSPHGQASAPAIVATPLPPSRSASGSAAPTGSGTRPATSSSTLAPTASGPHPAEITVARGDTLYAVARRYQLSTRAIIDANHLEPPYRLVAGRKLILPQTQTAASTSQWPIVTWAPPSAVAPAPPSAVATAPPSAVAPAPPVEPPRAPPEPKPAPKPAPEAAAPAASAPSPSTPVPAAPAAPTPAPSASAPAPTTPAAPAPEATPSTPPQGSETAALPPPPPRAGRSFLWPVHGRIIGRFGPGQNGGENDGIDIAAPEGTPVVAAESGIVAYAGNELRGYGNLVLLKHADGWMTAYGHNSKILVKRGDRVLRGQTIAHVGATGAVSEPQLHFELRKGTRALDPLNYLAPLAATSG